MKWIDSTFSKLYTIMLAKSTVSQTSHLALTLRVCVCVCVCVRELSVLVCECVLSVLCACVWVCGHWWLSGLDSGVLIKRLGVCWHDVQSSFSIQRTPNIIPTPVHPAVMGTQHLLGGKFPSPCLTHQLGVQVRLQVPTPISWETWSGLLQVSNPAPGGCIHWIIATA